jgi:hypothetical protein
MNRLLILFCLMISITWFTPVRAAIETGIVGQSGWSDNFYLGNPYGWGIFVSKSLSPKLSLRFSFGRLDNSFRYIGIMQFGLPPPEPDTTREFIHSDASVNFYEISIHHALVEGSKMRLDAGGGIGRADFDLHLYGESTGKTMSSAQSPTVLTFSVDVTVKQFIRSPLALRLGYQYREMSTPSQATDSFEPFNEVTFSSIHAAVLAWW